MTGPGLLLIPIEPDNPTHMAELRRQRELCCWGTEHLPKWQKLMRIGDKCLYWIQPSDPSLYPIPADEPFNIRDGFGPPPPDPAFQPLGHIALDREDYLDPPIKALASRETGSLLLASFFILKSQQGRGLGNKVMAMVEEEARRLGAPQITLDTLPAKDAARPEFWASLGPDTAFSPTAPVNQHWYARQGYEVFADNVPRYRCKNSKGEDVMLGLTLMRKILGPEAQAEAERPKE